MRDFSPGKVSIAEKKLTTGVDAGITAIINLMEKRIP